MSDLISQIQIDEIQAEPTFADWQEFQAWLDNLPADEPLYFPGDEQGLTAKMAVGARPSRTPLVTQKEKLFSKKFPFLALAY